MDKDKDQDNSKDQLETLSGIQLNHGYNFERTAENLGTSKEENLNLQNIIKNKLVDLP